MTIGLRVAIDRLAAACGKDWSKRPSAGHTAENALLAFEERLLPHHVGVVDELAVERLHPIHLLRSKASFGVYSLVAWTKAPVPRALL